MSGWSKVKWERLKFLRWMIRNPRMFAGRRYARAVGMHLSGDDRLRGIDRAELLRQINGLRAEAEVPIRRHRPDNPA